MPGTDQVGGSNNLERKDRRQAINEIPVFRLMTECVHSDDSAQTPADDGDGKQGMFRNTPCAVLCLPFINAHDSKADDINDQKIDDDRYNDSHF